MVCDIVDESGCGGGSLVVRICSGGNKNSTGDTNSYDRKSLKLSFLT